MNEKNTDCDSDAHCTNASHNVAFVDN